jgi:hypothetical protein
LLLFALTAGYLSGASGVGPSLVTLRTAEAMPA